MSDLLREAERREAGRLLLLLLLILARYGNARAAGWGEAELGFDLAEGERQLVRDPHLRELLHHADVALLVLDRVGLAVFFDERLGASPAHEHPAVAFEREAVRARQQTDRVQVLRDLLPD